jgi:hypothetical protein
VNVLVVQKQMLEFFVDGIAFSQVVEVLCDGLVEERLLPGEQ